MIFAPVMSKDLKMTDQRLAISKLKIKNLEVNR